MIIDLKMLKEVKLPLPLIKSWRENFGDHPVEFEVNKDLQGWFIENHARLWGGLVDKGLLPKFNMVNETINGDQSHANMRGVTIRFCDMTNCCMIRVELHGADLVGSNLSGVVLTGSEFQGADLTGVNLSGVIAKAAGFGGASMINVNLSGSNIIRADLTGADLRGADLTGVKLDYAVLDRADLSETKIDGISLKRASMRGTVIAGHLPQNLGLNQNQVQQVVWQ